MSATDQELTEAEVAALDAEGRAAEDAPPVAGTGEDGDDAAPNVTPPSPSPEDIERKLRTIGKAFDRYAAVVEREMGDDFAHLLVSPFDWQPGFIWNPEYATPDPEQIAAMAAYLGATQEQELQDADDAEPCAACSALGRVRTGSKVQGQETKPCRTCTGTGWVAKVQQIAPPQFPPAPPNGQTQLPPPNTPIQAADMWGRPAGHPHYGLSPAQVGV